jgi:glutathione synthase/RimK-type ligase-like ATP-grasp enzyme
LYIHKIASESGKAIAKPLPALRVFPNRRYRPRLSDVIINWGSSTTPNWERNGLTVLNPWNRVRNAINKIKCFTILSEAGVPIPLFTTNKEEAKAYFSNNNSIVVCRTTVTGSMGRGIVLARSVDEIVDAPLYTRHVRHKNEYRVHVVNGTIIDYAQKKKRAGSGASVLVRSHGDWVFCREGVVLPDNVRNAAVGAIQALGLDFGAVDIGYRVTDGEAYVFEVNTAPGMTATSGTAARYVTAFRNFEV